MVPQLKMINSILKEFLEKGKNKKYSKKIGRQKHKIALMCGRNIGDDGHVEA